MVISSLELCAGVGMLGEGVRAGFEFLGLKHRTVCYVEREAAAAGQLVTLMEAGVLDSAPIWSDMLTFRGSEWRGKVDCIIAGFPCQDLSVAGARKGLDGERSGLFFRVLDIADDSRAEFLFLENVRGITSATASVVDETEGELEERAASRVMGELADRGWDSEWMHVSASNVGASHGRERWFCLAWRRLAHTEHKRLERHEEGGREAVYGAKHSSGRLANTKIDYRGCEQPERSEESGRTGPTGSGENLADTSQQGLEGSQQRGTLQGNGNRQEAHGPTGEFCGAFGIFAPGPSSEQWESILEEFPFLSPAIESGLCGMVNGVALVVDESKAHQLRQIGNGVVPLAAAAAFIVLFQRFKTNG